MNLPLESANLIIQVIKPVVLISSLIIIKHLTIFLMDVSNMLNRLLNRSSSSSAAILILLEKRRSLIMLTFFLIILPLIFTLLSFNNDALYVLPFLESFLLLVETSFTSFSSAWSLFGQVLSPSRLVVSLFPFDGPVYFWLRVIDLHWWILDCPSVCWWISVSVFTSWSDIFFTRFTKSSCLYTIFDVAALQEFEQILDYLRIWHFQQCHNNKC